MEHPESQYVAKNEPATLNCKAEGDPTPVITWYRDGLPVTTANENPSSHRMLLPSGQLFFLRIINNKNSKPDVGTYYCNATNLQTGVSAVSRNATLQIAGRWSHFRAPAKLRHRSAKVVGKLSKKKTKMNGDVETTVDHILSSFLQLEYAVNDMESQTAIIPGESGSAGLPLDSSSP